MTTDDKIWDEKLQQNINREAVKISVLPSCKIVQCISVDEILSSGQKILI